MNIATIQIHKPLYETATGDMCGIYDRRIKDAIKHRQFIHIISQNGEATFNPKFIKKHCKTIEKIYLRENEPMKLYCVWIPRQSKAERDKEMLITSMG